MSLKKTGTCKECSRPVYGDEYGAAGHRCEAKDYNAMRLVAHEIIVELYQAEQRSHLGLLLNHIKSSLQGGGRHG